MRVFFLPLTLCALCLWAAPVAAKEIAPRSFQTQASLPAGQGAGEWRLRIREAAVAQGEMVRLCDIAEPHGPIAEQEWRNLAERSLWPAPPEAGKPLQITRVRLAQALRECLGDLAERCLLPSGLAVQRGGAVWYEDDLRAYLVKTLTPVLNVLPGQIELTDFRLPGYIFLAHAGQRIELEPVKPAAGRLNLRFQVMEVDGSAGRRFTGTAFVNVWADVACAAVPLNRGDVLKPETITVMTKNLAHIRGNLWDGLGGPWQAIRSLGGGQPILVADIEPQSAIRRGNIVALIFEKGNVKVSAQAEALADGSLGDTIAVRNLQSKKQVFGTVRDNLTVVAR